MYMDTKHIRKNICVSMVWLQPPSHYLKTKITTECTTQETLSFLTCTRLDLNVYRLLISPVTTSANPSHACFHIGPT